MAHHVSAIAIQAQAGLFLARSSSLTGATEAPETIDREAARTLAEMRTMASALRDRREQPPLVPQRRIADIAELATDGTETLHVGVELHGDLTGLPPAVEGALYRVTQESITNAQRHARHATEVRVEVTGGDTDVRLTVSDDGARVASAGEPSGFGLVGMTERVTLLGGTLTAGPDPDRGWSVRAVLPPRRRHMTVRVLIADDQGIVRAGLTTILHGQQGMEVLGQASGGRRRSRWPRIRSRSS